MRPEKPNFNNEPSHIEQQESIEITWEKILSKFPDQLKQEFRDERPNPNQEDIEQFKSLHLLSPDSVSIPLTELLKSNENYIFLSPPDIIEEINEKWGTKFDVNLSKVYDQDSDRLRKYSLMPPETARPSVLVDGEFIFGLGRFIAALLRKDSNLRVWKLSSKQ